MNIASTIRIRLSQLIRQLPARLLILRGAAGFLLLLIPVGSGQAQSTTQMLVKMAVQPTITLVFQNTSNAGSVGNCALTNANTSNVGLNLGDFYNTQYSDTLPCVSWSNISNGFQIQSYFYIVVTEQNSTSSSYTLSAIISQQPPTGVSWYVTAQNQVQLNSTNYTTLTKTGSYTGPLTAALQVQVLNSVPDQVLQETVTFLATAN